jgi:Protein of unknown function (DUF3108)
VRAVPIILLVGSVGCGGKAAVEPSRPAVSGVPWASNKPLVEPGERMSYRLALKGLELASYTLAASDVQVLDGKRTVVVESHARSVGLASLVAKVDDRFTSWIDLETGRPRRFQTAEYETNSDTNIEHVIVDFAGRKDDLVPVSFHLNDGPPTEEPQRVRERDVWDYNAFLVALRSWEPQDGATISTEVFRSRFLWKIDVKVHGKTTLVTELGELPALRFDGHAVKLARDGSKFPDTSERDFSIWISDDEGRVPLRNTAITDYGDIEMTIVDYQPGSGAAP